MEDEKRGQALRPRLNTEAAGYPAAFFSAGWRNRPEPGEIDSARSWPQFRWISSSIDPRLRMLLVFHEHAASARHECLMHSHDT
jgi:hypothetical protein